MKINTHTSHPSAFISSTFIDLMDERAAIAKTLRSRGLNINALDTKPASTNSSKNEILTGIRESDFVILVIGDRYGSILKRMTESESNSVTMWEYQRARLLRKPVIAYFKSNVGHDPKYHDDISDPSYKLKRKRFSIFKDVVSSRHNPAYFSTPEELSEKIDQALISIYRDGVRRMGEVNLRLSSKIDELETELSKLQSASSISTPSSSPEHSLFEHLSGGRPASTQRGLLKNPLSGFLDDET